MATSCDEAVCLNRRVQGFGPPAEVLTEDVLSRTYRRHLLAVAGQPSVLIAQDEHLDGDGEAG